MIDKLYNKISPIIFKGIEEEYKSEVESGLKNYLYNRYKDSFNDPKTAENRLKSYINIETEYWKNAPVDFKLFSFVHDENFEMLEKLSREIYNLAKSKMINDYKVDIKPSKEEMDKLISYFVKLSENVKPFNLRTAKNILSETILDYQYVFNKTDILSLRLGREYQSINNLNKIKNNK